MVNCSVVGCKSRSERKEEHITFHRFPRDLMYRSKWIECTGRVNWQPSVHSRICSRHFKLKCFQPTKKNTYMNIKPYSIPTLHIEIQHQLNEIVDQESTSSCESSASIDTKELSIENDMENNVKYKLVEGILKRKILCQEQRNEVKERLAVQKRHINETVGKVLHGDLTNSIEEIFVVHSDAHKTVNEDSSETLEANYEANPEPVFDEKCRKKIQVCIKNKSRHKSLGDHYDHNYSKNEDIVEISESPVVARADDVTAPPEFSWQRPPEVIPCADDVDIQIDVSPTAPVSAGRDGGDDRRPIGSYNDRLHVGYKCNECGSEIVGYRYTCVQCCGVELCGACEASGAHPEHYVLRLPRPEPAGRLGGLLETLRRLLDQELLPPVYQVKKEEIDEEDPLSCGFVAPEPASFDYDDIEAEELKEEESKEEIHSSISNIPTDTARSQLLDNARLDVGDCTLKNVLLRHRNPSEVMPILKANSVVQRSAVRPYQEGTEPSDVRRGLTISGTSVTRLGADPRASGTAACAPKLPEKLYSLDDQILYEAKRIKRV